MKSKTITILLAFFLGGIGAHRFYLGQTGLGLLYLVFFWTFIPGLIAIIDIICFLVMSDEEFDQKYNLLYMDSKSQQEPHSGAFSYNMGNANRQNTSVAEEIKKLYELKEKGIITEEEFEQKKKDLLK